MFFGRSHGELRLPPGVKPNGVPRIDWLHPMAQGLVFCAFDTGDGRVIDLVGGKEATLSGTIPGTKLTAWGQGFNCNASLLATFSISRLLYEALHSGAGFSSCTLFTQYSDTATYTQPMNYFSASLGGSAVRVDCCRGTSTDDAFFFTTTSGGTNVGSFNQATFGGGSPPVVLNNSLRAIWANFWGDTANTVEGAHLFGGSGVRNANESWAGNYPSTGAGYFTDTKSLDKTKLNIANDSLRTHNMISGAVFFMSCFWARRFYKTDMVAFVQDPYAFLAPPRFALGPWYFRRFLSLHSDVTDNGLSELHDHATVLYLCTQEPTSYAEASSTYAKGSAAVTFGAPTADAAGEGRKVVSDAISGGTISADGSVTHWAVVDPAGAGRLLATGTFENAVSVESGQGFTLGALHLAVPRE